MIPFLRGATSAASLRALYPSLASSYSTSPPWLDDIASANQELEEVFNMRLSEHHHSSLAGPETPSSLPQWGGPHSQVPASNTPGLEPHPVSTLSPTSHNTLHYNQSFAASPQQQQMQQQQEKEESMSANRLTHVDDRGHASMVDVSQKVPSIRYAQASGCVHLGPKAFNLVAANKAAKGDVLAVSQIAGIMAAKQTSTLIPLCHGIPISKVRVAFHLDSSTHSVHISTEATSIGVTGVEMEALTAACIAGLTIYDMCKAVSKGIVISDVRLEVKEGGKSGEWRRS